MMLPPVDTGSILKLRQQILERSSALGQILGAGFRALGSDARCTDDELHAAVEAEPAEIIKATQTVEGGGWTLTAPVTIAVHSGERVNTLGQLPMACTHDKKTGKTTATLQLPGQ